MNNDINYLDLLILKKLEPDSTIEKFGPIINTSFFETANILGTMKVKGLIDIQSSIGGLSPIIVLPAAKDLISLAIKKASEPLDQLDFEILLLLKKGIKELYVLEKTLNITSFDLALRLYKLRSNNYISDQVQSAKVYLSLTEKGFLLAKEKDGTLATSSSPSKEQPAKEAPQTTSDIDSEIKDLIFDKKFEQKPPSSQQPSSQGTTPTFLSTQKQKRRLPWEKEEEKPVKLDTTTKIIAKIEYYLQNYWFYLLLSFILVFLLFVALILILIK
ncbi:MAG: hypothetical protein N3D10_01465 [Candidatus Micrarchaeota archaeon]|nr:hypothetical protein [Candidatus Micrarchaeota archaeon]